VSRTIAIVVDGGIATAPMPMVRTVETTVASASSTSSSVGHPALTRMLGITADAREVAVVSETE
jgi:hypothetical protein